MNEKYASADAALYIGIKPGTLNVWRCTKHVPQPPYVRIGNRIFYLKKDLDAFIESQKVHVGV
jgi:hypothetical protein